MIVRIATEEQYHVPDEDATRLNDLDNQAVAAVEAGDRERFTELFGQMVELVRTDGRRIPDTDIEESDVILPPSDTSFEEARDDFTGDGLIPG